MAQQSDGNRHAAHNSEHSKYVLLRLNPSWAAKRPRSYLTHPSGPDFAVTLMITYVHLWDRSPWIGRMLGEWQATRGKSSRAHASEVSRRVDSLGADCGYSGDDQLQPVLHLAGRRAARGDAGIAIRAAGGIKFATAVESFLSQAVNTSAHLRCKRPSGSPGDQTEVYCDPMIYVVCQSDLRKRLWINDFRRTTHPFRIVVSK